MNLEHLPWIWHLLLKEDVISVTRGRCHITTLSFRGVLLSSSFAFSCVSFICLYRRLLRFRAFFYLFMLCLMFISYLYKVKLSEKRAIFTPCLVDLWEVSGDTSDCKFTRQNIFHSGQNKVSRLHYTEKILIKMLHQLRYRNNWIIHHRHHKRINPNIIYVKLQFIISLPKSPLNRFLSEVPLSWLTSVFYETPSLPVRLTVISRHSTGTTGKPRPFRPWIKVITGLCHACDSCSVLRVLLFSCSRLLSLVL